MHVIRLVRLVALAVAVGQVDHLLNQLSVEDHTTAAGLWKNVRKVFEIYINICFFFGNQQIIASTKIEIILEI